MTILSGSFINASGTNFSDFRRTSPETMSTGGMPSFPPRRPWESSSELGCPVPTEAGIVLLEDCFRAYLSLKQQKQKEHMLDCFIIWFCFQTSRHFEVAKPEGPTCGCSSSLVKSLGTIRWCELEAIRWWITDDLPIEIWWVNRYNVVNFDD